VFIIPYDPGKVTPAVMLETIDKTNLKLKGKIVPAP
jgi:hypothetical protein